MEKLVSTWSNGKTLPENYIFPPGKRPEKHLIATSNTVLPVIDLGKLGSDNCQNIVQKIMEACKEFGFFQVINHGISMRLMDEARDVFKEFFELPTEERSKFLTLEMSQKCMLYTSNVDYENEEIHNWRDSLRHSCTPLEECMKYWPQKPARYREIVGEYVVQARELGSRILELICQGLGLEPGYFAKELNQEQVLAVHHYPPCPDPSLTLGARKHFDPCLLTILLQGNVPGLQVLKDGEWIGVEAIPHAFVVNIGHQLQIVSNGKLVSVEHRAVTNKDEARITAALFMEPTKNSLVEPAKGVVSVENPPIYKCFRYEEFLKTFRAFYVGEIDEVLEPYRIQGNKMKALEDVANNNVMT